MWRYSEDIPARTFNSYRSRRKIEARAAENPLELYAREGMLDVISERATLIAMQKVRVSLDLRHEAGDGEPVGHDTVGGAGVVGFVVGAQG